MHTIEKKPITLDCFETDGWYKDFDLYDHYNFIDFVELDFLPIIENLRKKYLETKDKRYWKELIRWLPESWLQTRTVTMTYENLLAMCSKGQRRFHKLTEWSGDGEDFLYESFIKMARSLPFAQDLIFIDELT